MKYKYVTAPIAYVASCIYNMTIILPEPISFEWDRGNKTKNFVKHRVSIEECEQVFDNQNHVIAKDYIHSVIENRYVIIGETKQNRTLFIVFIIRTNKVRVISARDLNRKERPLYEKAISAS